MYNWMLISALELVTAFGCLQLGRLHVRAFLCCSVITYKLFEITLKAVS
jgi:hypothetical protein